jgi:hypothetical protein
VLNWTTAHGLWFRAPVATGEPLTVGCTQEGPLYSEISTIKSSRISQRYIAIAETACRQTRHAKKV